MKNSDIVNNFVNTGYVRRTVKNTIKSVKQDFQKNFLFKRKISVTNYQKWVLIIKNAKNT